MKTKHGLFTGIVVRATVVAFLAAVFSFTLLGCKTDSDDGGNGTGTGGEQTGTGGTGTGGTETGGTGTGGTGTGGTGTGGTGTGGTGTGGTGTGGTETGGTGTGGTETGGTGTGGTGTGGTGTGGTGTGGTGTGGTGTGGTGTGGTGTPDGTSKERAIPLPSDVHGLAGSIATVVEEKWYVYTQPERGQVTLLLMHHPNVERYTAVVNVSVYWGDDRIGTFGGQLATSTEANMFSVSQIYAGEQIYLRIAPFTAGTFNISR